MPRISAEVSAEFLWEDTICRHSYCGKLVLDGGPGNAGLVKAFTNKYRIDRLVTSRYNLEANGMVKGDTDLLLMRWHNYQKARTSVEAGLTRGAMV